jgi:hypothetical protein
VDRRGISSRAFDPKDRGQILDHDREGDLYIAPQTIVLRSISRQGEAGIWLSHLLQPPSNQIEA